MSDDEGARLFIVPAGNPEALKHFSLSVLRGVAPEVYEGKLSDGLVAEFLEAAGSLFAWGCVPGEGNTRTWERLTRNDYVTFLHGKRFAAVARIIGKERNREFAEALWGSEEDGSVFELVYTLTQPKLIDVDLADFAEWLPGTVRGFQQLKAERASAIANHFGSIEAFVEEELLRAGSRRRMLVRIASSSLETIDRELGLAVVLAEGSRLV